MREHVGSHLHELRRRLIISLVVMAAASGLAYAFAEQLADVAVRPLFAAAPHLAGLVYTNLTEAFLAYLKLALTVGVGASLPVVVYHAWRFAAPGLYEHEKRTALVVVCIAFVLFAGGALFSFFVALPWILSFLMSFTTEAMRPMPKFGAYLTFVVRTSIAFGLAFEIPFLMTAAVRYGLVAKGYFAAKRLYSYGGILMVGFLLAAGDPVAAVLIAAPLCLLYETGILGGRLLGGREAA